MKLLNFNALVLEGKKKLLFKKIQFKNELKKNQVLVKIFYSGICGKQIEEYTYQKGKDKFLPHLLGHEGSGKIVKVGPGVKSLKKGDYVVLHWMRNKSIKDCDTPYFYDSNLKKKINAGWITTFSEYSVISSNRLTKVSSKTDLRLAALMGCCLSTGIGTVINQSKIESTDNALVVGCGGVGLSVIIGLNLCGNKKISAADVNQKNLKKAKELGAHNLINLKHRNRVNKRNFKKVFISTGSKKGIESAINLASDKSDIYFIGVPNPNDKILIKPFQIHNGKKLHPSSGGDISPKRDIPLYLKKLKKKNILKNFIINEVKLQNALKIINLMSKGKLNHGRNLIKM
jgi:S-(hydroxymethyl)glutathione dehydrogenase/alcohol dehydrogenase